MASTSATPASLSRAWWRSVLVAAILDLSSCMRRFALTQWHSSSPTNASLSSLLMSTQPTSAGPSPTSISSRPYSLSSLRLSLLRRPCSMQEQSRDRSLISSAKRWRMLMLRRPYERTSAPSAPTIQLQMLSVSHARMSSAFGTGSVEDSVCQVLWACSHCLSTMGLK